MSHKCRSALQAQEPFEMEIVHVYMICTVFLMYTQTHMYTYLDMCTCIYIYKLHYIEPEIRINFLSLMTA